MSNYSNSLFNSLTRYDQVIFNTSPLPHDSRSRSVHNPLLYCGVEKTSKFHIFLPLIGRQPWITGRLIFSIFNKLSHFLPSFIFPHQVSRATYIAKKINFYTRQYASYSSIWWLNRKKIWLKFLMALSKTWQYIASLCTFDIVSFLI